MTLRLPIISGNNPYRGVLETGRQDNENKLLRETLPISSVAWPSTSGIDSRKINIRIRIINANETNAIEAIIFSAINSPMRNVRRVDGFLSVSGCI